MEVTETMLPGVGLRYEFITSHGAHLGLVARRDRQVDIVVYDRGDPDLSTEVVRLSAAEAETLAELLGAPKLTERFADLTREIPGLEAAQVKVPENSRFAGRLLGDTRARTLTGASIVALVRGEHVLASPSPTDRLQSRDVLVVIGTSEGISGVRHILDEPSG